MKALTWHGPRSVEVDEVPDAVLVEPTDAIIRVTSTAICGSDLHLYDVLGPYLSRGDILGHEAMGIVERVGAGVRRIKPGDRVVVPFVIACGQCFMCKAGLQSQCQTTQRRDRDTGAALYGYSSLYGSVPGGQAELLRVLRADDNAVVVGRDLSDERYLFLSDILPTAWQGVAYAGLSQGDCVAVLGLGPVGQFVARICRMNGYDVMAVDPIPERRAMAERHGIPAIDLDEHTAAELQLRTLGRGPDAVIDAVGMEAAGAPAVGFAQHALNFMPSSLGQSMAEIGGVDRLGALTLAIDAVRRGGTLSLLGVYGGTADPLPMRTLFDKQVTVKMGQCNVHHWVPDLLPLVEDPQDPLGTEDLVTHRVPLTQAAEMYDVFREKRDGCIKVVLEP